MNQRLQKALELSEKILEDIELENEKLSSIILKCLRLARLIDDLDSMEWLQYEIEGYKKSTNGKIEHHVFEIAKNHGRSYINIDNKQENVFLEIVEELEASIEANYKRINNITTQGASVSGEKSYIAMSNLTNSAKQYGNAIVIMIKENQKKIGILKGEYYKYALSVNLELGFSKTAEDIFQNYREDVDSKLSNIIGDSEEKLSAIYERLSENNKESWSQAADTCRKLFKSVADNLFDRLYPNYSQKTVKVKSGKDIEITGDKYINRLTVCLDSIDKLSNKHIEDTISWIKKLNEKICDGVHNDITYKEMQQIIIHTYICLGDIIRNIELE